jgi:gamma-glutamylcyclotransferase (GGCT)/AIG2-like uncharacterized protein YtfP
MEELEDRKKIIRFIERLYCKCGNNSLYKNYKEYLGMKEFAKAIGGEYYSANIVFESLDKKIEKYGLTEFLPGKKRQLVLFGELGISVLRKLYPEATLESMAATTTKNICIPSSTWYGRQDKIYYLCKNCCDICRFQTKGCTIHCRNTFCDYLSLMSTLDVSKLIQRQDKVSDKNIKKFHEYIAKIFGKNKQLKSTGYIRSYLDIAVYIYLRYDVGFEEALSAITPLLDQNIPNNSAH